MLKTVANIFKISDLRGKILFTIAMLIIYRVGFYIPVPGFAYQEVMSVASSDTDTATGRAVEFMQMVTGGTFSKSSLFGLGIMPYITASIILMLLGEILPALKKLRQEGQAGQKKIQEYTRYLTVLICIIQGMIYMRLFVSGHKVYTGMERQAFIMGIIGMTAGTIFLMWLGEQIDEYGIGNGISIIIMAGIISRLPINAWLLAKSVKFTVATEPGQIGPSQLIFLLASFGFVVASVILITQGQRRIPIQQAKQMRGMKMYGGARHYIPLRVNHAGVMPIIFASSFMMFLPLMVEYLRKVFDGKMENSVWNVVQGAFGNTAFTYNLLYMVLIFLFAYFWVTVQFQPKDMAKNLQDSGSFIPGLRPGRRTADYLETVVTRVTYYGAAFLAIIAVVPQVVMLLLGVSWGIANFLGGTGLLIMVSVSLDVVQKIEANLIMRNYDGFSSSGRIKGAR